jgi:hypothetical protein
MNRAGATVLVIALSLGLPSAGRAQNRIAPAAIGALAGMGAGGYVSLGVVTERARRGHYLFILKDAFGWDSAAVLAGGSTGIALGLWDPNRLRNTILATAGLGLVGTGIGAVIGHARWAPPEGKWAGAVIGGGAGVLVGAVVGVLLPPDLLGSDTNTGIPFLVRIPVSR